MGEKEIEIKTVISILLLGGSEEYATRSRLNYLHKLLKLWSVSEQGFSEVGWEILEEGHYKTWLETLKKILLEEEKYEEIVMLEL